MNNEKKGPHVFVIDDNASIRQDLEVSLDLRDITVESFADGKSVLERLAEQPTDLYPTALIVDLVLPGKIGGEELLKKLLKNYSGIPVIVMSGLDIQGSWGTYGQGVYAVMQKPVDYNELEGVLRELADTDQIFMRMAENFRFLATGRATLVWREERYLQSYKIVGWNGVDRDYISNIVDRGGAGVQILKGGKKEIQINLESAKGFHFKEQAMERGWRSLICLPIRKNNQFVGWLEVYYDQKLQLNGQTGKVVDLAPLRIFADQAGEIMYSRGITQFLRIVQELNQNLAGTLQEQQLYRTILKKILQATGADYGWVYRYHVKRQVIRRIAEVGQGAGKLDQERSVRNKGGGIIGKVARTGRSMYLPDVEQPSRDQGKYKPLLNIRTEGIKERSFLAIPLRQGQRTLGVLAIASKSIDFFRSEDQLLVTALAATVAISMERNKLTQHLQGISRLAQERANFKELANYVVMAVKDLTNTEVNLWMMSRRENEGDDYMRIFATSSPNLSKDYMNNTCLPTSIGSCMNANALHRREHLIIADIVEYRDNPPLLNQETIINKGWRSFMVVPLLGKNNEHLGVISLFSDEKRRFSDEDGLLVRHFADQAALVLQEQRHIAVLQELVKVGQDLTIVGANPRKLLDKVAKLAKKIANAELVVMYPYDLNRQDYYETEYIVTAGDLRTEGKRVNNKPRANGLAAFIRQHGAVVVENIAENKFEFRTDLNDPKQHSIGSWEAQQVELLIRESKFIKRENIQAFIGVSLQAVERKTTQVDQHQEVAVLYFNYRAPRHFSQDELQVIGIFCHQVANVIHRYRLFDILQKEKSVIEAVHQSALAIQEELNLTDRLQKVVDQAVSLLKAKGGKIYLVTNRGNRELSLKASRKLPKGIMENYTLPKGKGLAREVIEKRRPIILPSSEEGLPPYNEYEHRVPKLAKLFSAVAEVPLFLKDEAIGVLGVFDDVKKRIFTKEDAVILEKLAAQAALAIYNGQLYDELDALYQTGTEIAKQSAPEVMGDKILRELKKVIEYDKASLQVFSSWDTPRRLLARIGYSGNKKFDSELLRPIDDDELIKPIIQKRKIQIISDTAKEPKFDRKIPDTKDVKSWVGIPLVYGDTVLGLISLDHLQKDYYSEKDIPKLERFAIQAAIGVYNANLEQEHLRILGDFVKITEKVEIDNAPEKALQHAFKAAVKAFEHNRVKARYILTKNGLLDIPLLKSLDVSVANIDRDDAIHRWVEENRRIFLHYMDYPYPLKPGEQKLIAPVFVGEVLQGMMELVSLDNEFRHNHKNFLRVIAHLTSDNLFRINSKRRQREALKNNYNPYILGRPIKDPEKFYGRSNELQTILNGIHQNNFIIESERRIGKTSVLFQLEYYLQNKEDGKRQYLPVFLNLEGTLSEETIWLQMIDQLRFTLGLTRLSSKRPYDFRDFHYDVRRLLDDQEKKLQSKELKIVYLLDEMDVFNNYSDKCLNHFRKIFQEEQRLHVIMAGVAIDRKNRIMTSPWYNQLVPIKIHPLNREEAIQVIIDPVKGIYSYTSEAIEKILQITEMKPFLIQQLCYRAVQNMLARLSGTTVAFIPEVTIQDINKVLQLES